MPSNLQLPGTITQKEKINDTFANLLHQNCKIKKGDFDYLKRPILCSTQIMEIHRESGMERIF